MDIVLYSAIYGESDWVKPIPADLGVPAIMYTDSKKTASDAEWSGWEPRIVRHGIATLKGDPQITAPMLAHKWWKTHPPDADISIWIDGSMEICIADFVDQCLAVLGTDDWACVRHPARGCIYPEAEYSATLTWRYDAESIHAQARFYSQFHPRDFGLIATGHNVRRHTPDVLKLSDDWWIECLQWSHQDQLSLPVLLRLAEEKIAWNMNLPWHQWWKLHEHGHADDAR